MRILVLLLSATVLNGCAYYFGNRWQNSFKRIPATSYPSFSKHPQRIAEDQLRTHPLVLHFASKEVIRPNKKDQRGPERLLLAKLVAGTDIEAVNNYLLEMVPWGNSGTSGALNPRGDYDFTTVILAAILHRFAEQPSILWDTTEAHVANVLLVEEGGKPHTRTPRTAGIMKDTENHILMTNISQYLKNQWMWAHGATDPKFDNLQNGLEQFLLDNLEELHVTGQYEFNSKPYEGYTISALLILRDHTASAQIKSKVTEVLDAWAWEYMQTSYRFRKSAPFRRRMERFKSTSLTDNPSTSFMKAWWLEQRKGTFEVADIPHNHHQAFMAVISDYRPPTELWEADDTERLILIGHGRGSSPEIHSRGPGFMLSAGGFQRGEVSQIVARPIVLMLDDGVTDLDSCFHINGKGKWQQWNNTGVHHRFAVGAQPVSIPPQYQAVDSLGNWRLFKPQNGMQVVAFSSSDLGLIYLPSSEVSLSELNAMNEELQQGLFKANGTTMRFYLDAPKGKWVITEHNDRSLSRRTDTWQRLTVTPQ